MPDTEEDKYVWLDGDWTPEMIEDEWREQIPDWALFSCHEVRGDQVVVEVLPEEERRIQIGKYRRLRAAAVEMLRVLGDTSSESNG